MKKYIFLLLFLPNLLMAQKEQTPQQAAEQEEVKQLVSFLEYTLNLLGDSTITPAEKDVIVTQSYEKIFLNDKVQVEDDLDENRKTVTNKDIQAYLKDIDFFFRNVSFLYDVQSIERDVDTRGDTYFKVTLERELSGTLINGKKVKNVHPRYLEINLDRNNKMLKVVSMYTSGLSEREDMAAWWDYLPPYYKQLFGNEVALSGSYTLAQFAQENPAVAITADTTLNGVQYSIDNPIIYRALHQLWTTERLDLSGNNDIKSLEPLVKLTNLKSLNLEGLQITDLKPIRNMARLQELNLSNTLVSKLDPLRYMSRLQSLNVSGSPVDKLSGLEQMNQLHKLVLNRTLVSDLSPFSTCLSCTASASEAPG